MSPKRQGDLISSSRQSTRPLRLACPINLRISSDDTLAEGQKPRRLSAEALGRKVHPLYGAWCLGRRSHFAVKIGQRHFLNIGIDPLGHLLLFPERSLKVWPCAVRTSWPAKR